MNGKGSARRKEDNATQYRSNWDRIFGHKDAEKKAPDPENRCGGMSCCKDRKYDSTKDDCKECMDDYDDAMDMVEEMNSKGC